MELETKTIRSTSVSPSVQSTGVLSINRRRKQSKPRQVASSAELENGASEQDGREDGKADTDHDLKSSDDVICPNCHQIFEAPDDLTGHDCNSVVSTATKAFDNAMDDLDDVEEEGVDDDDDVEEDFRYTDDSQEPEVVKMAAAAGDMLNSDTESTLSKRWYHSATEKWGNIFGGRITEQQRSEDQIGSPYNLSVKDFRTSGGSSAVETSMTSSGGHDQPLQSPTVGFNMAAAAGAMGAMFMLDSSLPPSSKIAILESAVYGLYRQQMIQLELIETLRRQLAVALAAANSVSGGNGSKLSPSTIAHPGNESSTVDEEEPLTTSCSQSAADMTSSNMADSSLSSLMRFSASATVDTRMSVTSTEATWPPTQMQGGSGNSESGNRNQQNFGDDLESASKSSGHVTKLPIQSSGGSLADLTLFKKAKPPNVTVGRISEQRSNVASDAPMSGSAPSASGGDESGVFKHRCHMCYKVLGSDSALQIHLRSHTGERPYKCNICGNRFTTKGNLKVHFQRHLEQFPNARMNPDPVPEYFDHHLPPTTSSLTPAFFERSFQATTAVGMQSPSSADMSLSRPNVRLPETPLKSAGVPSDAASEPNMSAIKMEPRGVAPARPNYIQDQLPAAHDNKPELTTSALPLTNAIPSTSALSTSKFDSHSTPSPLSALSSMSSALTTSFPPSHHHQLSRGLHPTAPQPAVPSTVTPQPIPMHVGGGGSGNSPSGAYSPFRIAAAAAPGILSPLLKGPLDLDNDEELEQYMEIQSTDTTKIEEMVREATLAAQESSKSDGGASIDPNECVLCHRVLSCRSALQMHYRTHTGERPFRCRLCGRTFTTKGNLKTHMTVHRSRNPAFGGTILGNQRCPVCRREFTGSLALQQHIRAAHSTPSVSTSQAASAASNSGGHQPLPPQVAAGVPPFTANLPAGAQNPMVGNAAAVHAAAAAAAAMMMSMPGLNPLLNPFVKFPAAAAALYQGANGPFAQPFPFGASGLGDGGCGAVELDLRKTNKSGGVKEKTGVNSKEKRRSDDVDHDEDDEEYDNYSEDNVTVNKRRRGNPEHIIEETSTSSDQVLKFTLRQTDMEDAEATGCGKVSDKVHHDSGDDTSGGHKNIGKIVSTATDEEGDGGEFRNVDEWDRNSISQSENSLDQSDKEKFNANQLTHEESILNLKNRQEERSSPSSRTQLRPSPPLSSDDRQFQTAVESHSGSSCSPTSSPDVAAHGPDSSGNSSCSNRDPALNYDHQTLPKPTVQPPHHQSTTGSRFACTVCAKPFASASALEIHSRTHSGDRPFICPVCSKAFTTKGNLKVHMGTHAWNRCPSRRGRRMTVVDPTTAAVVAAASVGTTATSGCPPAVGTLPQVTAPAGVADFFAAGNTPFGRFVPDISAPNSLPVRPMSVFGFTRPPAAAAGSVAPPAFFPDIAAAAAAWPFINFGGGFLPGPKTSAEQASDSEKLLPSAIVNRNGGDERNNNDAENRNKDDGGETRNRSYSSPSSSGSTRLQNGFSPRSTGCESTGGELDLSVGGNIRTTRTGFDVIAPAGCSSTTGQSLQIKGHHRISGASSGNSGWTGASDRGTTMPPLLSNCG